MTAMHMVIVYLLKSIPEHQFRPCCQTSKCMNEQHHREVYDVYSIAAITQREQLISFFTACQ